MVFAVFEELGWRGYLVPKLASSGLNDFASYALTGIVWAAWHIPYVFDLAWVYTSGNTVIFIPLFFLSLCGYSILYHEIRLLSGSVWPAVFLHGFTNALQHPLSAEFLRINPESAFIFSFTGIFMTFLVSLLGLVLRFRRKQLSGRQ